MKIPIQITPIDNGYLVSTPPMAEQNTVPGMQPKQINPTCVFCFKKDQVIDTVETILDHSEKE